MAKTTASPTNHPSSADAAGRPSQSTNNNRRVSRRRPSRPVLCYFGGKYRLTAKIAALFPPHRTYVEPFAGAASVLMAKPRCRTEVYNDLDDRVVNVFRILRNPTQAAALREQLRLTPYSATECQLCWDRSFDPIEDARRTIYRSFAGFGSAGLLKSACGFRRPRPDASSCSASWASYPDTIDALVDRLSGVTIESRDALELIPLYDSPGTLYYVDPPYLPETRVSGEYRHELTRDDHVALAGVLHQVRGMVVLSGYRSALYADLYPGWRSVSFAATAMNKAAPRTECVWFSPNIPVA